MALAAASGVGCKDSASEPAPEPPGLDLSGVWAGTFTGTTTYAGTITGNWEADVVQGASGMFGAFTMSGDADCLDGSVAGSLGAGGVLSGQILRSPCQDDGWTMTALNLLDRSTAGIWDQPYYGSYGTFTGIQVARAGGPRVRFISPPAAPPGSIVSVVGSGFDPDPPRNAVDFDGIPAATPLTATSTVLTVRVPASAATGPVYVTTPAGTALSPRRFDTAPTHPGSFVSATLLLSEQAAAPASVAIDNEGRKAYVAGTRDGAVAIVNTATQTFIASSRLDPSRWVPAQGLVVSPDARRVYVASGAAGVTVLQSALARIIEVIPVPAGGTTRGTPQGLAISPDGETLYVSEDSDGGAVRVVDLASREVLAVVSRGGGTSPAGVVAAPDGRRAYFAFRGASEGVAVFDRETLTVTGTLATGPGPVGAAVTPDGRKLYVANEQGASVTRWDLEAGASVTIAVGAQPLGIAVTPDGERVLVVNGSSGTLSVISTATDAVLESSRLETLPYDPTSFPYGVTVSPDGRRAYVSCPSSDKVFEIGGPATLTVAKEGSGLGTVTSSPDGISCGPACVARFDQGTVVTLTASASPGSTFSGWGGDCQGDTVTVSGSMRCTATFTYVSGGDGTSEVGAPAGTTGGCFIATAAFGSPMAPQVQALRDFRDRHLLGNAPGRAFVRAYYAHSPPVARYLRQHEAARTLTRWALAPAVFAVSHPLAALSLTTLLAAGLALAVGRRRRAALPAGGGR